MRKFSAIGYSMFLLNLIVVFSNTIIAQTQIRDLTNLYEYGYILQDTNQDSVVDFIRAKIIVPKNPTEAEIAGAANIAARLGYETSAINLDLVDEYSPENSYHLPIIMISDQLNKANLKEGLAPGQGRILFEPPGDIHNGIITILGADDTGLLTAANYFAGRYPDLWTLKGETFSGVKKKLETFFTQNKIQMKYLLINSVDIDNKAEGIIKLGVKIFTDHKQNFTKLVRAFSGTAKRDTVKNSSKDLKLSDLEFQNVHKISIQIVSPDSTKTINLLSKKQFTAKIPAKPPRSSQRSFSLSQFYTIAGIYRDGNKDFIPDDVPISISTGGVKRATGLSKWVTRIGLESAGIKIPLVRIAGEEDYPENFGFPILFGLNHYKIKQLRENNKLVSASQFPDAGSIQFVSKAFNDKNAIVVSAENQSGLDAISNYAAEKVPYLWKYGKGNFTLKNIEADVKNFFQLRKAPGQVVFALHKLETWLKRIQKTEPDSISVELAAEKTPAGLDDYIENLAHRYLGSIKVTSKLYPTGFGTGKHIFKDEIEIPWEVDDFWNLFRSSVLPNIQANSKGKIRVLISESPEIRKKLTRQIQKELLAKGLKTGSIEVVVLCAYKQGYSWLYDEVLPRIRKKKTARIEITYHTLKNSKEIRWQTINANTRWLQELYPIDAVLSKQLNIADSAITFHPSDQKDPIYTVKIFDKKNKLLFEDSYSPKYVIRPFFDLFPEYESVRVTTGWVNAEIDGKCLIDERIKTDPEKFWDFLQTSTYRKISNYVMDIQDGKPASGNAPYFDKFTVNLTLSEPNYKLGIDEEVISSVEALHEDIYFETLTLFNLIGSRYGAGSMNFPGRIIPLIQPPKDGSPGKAIIELTGKDKALPQIVLTYWKKGKAAIKQKYELSNFKIPDPKLTGIWIEPDSDGVSQLMFEITANDSIDRYEEFKKRSSEMSIDRTFIPIGSLTNMVNILHKLHNMGIFENQLSYDKVKNLLFRVVLEDSSNYADFADLPRSQHPKSTENPKLFAENFRYSGKRIVQWDTPLSPQETEEILAKLNTFPNIHVYFTVNSFSGQPVFAMDLLPKTESNYISELKLTALKPTLFISGRQHANEVSSTSHILRLAELAATDSTYAKLLKKVNLVLHPITNIDGAKLGIELHQTNPHFMLHAAYLGPLGVDVDRGAGFYPETQVRKQLRETWLPDVYLNPHGYPSHEWVQYFAGYSAWVRNRKGGQRSWWAPRGWFIPGFRWIEDKKYPDHKKVSFAILDSIASSITALPEVMEINRRMYKRYKKYGIQDRENFREYFYKDILVNAALKGSKLKDNKITGPKVTYFSLTTEAPDETATGEWLQMVCRAGLAHTTAVLNYLAAGKNRIIHEVKEDRFGVHRSVFRKRPVLPVVKK